MIPKIIHYCWFGGKPLPKSAIKCIESWKKFFPDYEIKQWNESNFDIYETRYSAQAYQAGKYAFVSDYARYKILFEEGGIYFDTDVEVIKSFDDVLANGPFMGFEIDPGKGRDFAIAPGLGMGAEPFMDFYKKAIDAYLYHPGFLNEDGTYNTEYAIVRITTQLMKKAGIEASIKETPGIQKVDGITIYPADWFNPLDYATGKLHITPETHSIHWFTKSWAPRNPVRDYLAKIYHRIRGIHTR